MVSAKYYVLVNIRLYKLFAGQGREISAFPPAFFSTIY